MDYIYIIVQKFVWHALYSNPSYATDGSRGQIVKRCICDV
jgi:hypothetical protein